MALQQCGIVALSVGSQTGAHHEATLERLIMLLPQYNQITIWFDDSLLLYGREDATILTATKRVLTLMLVEKF